MARGIRGTYDCLIAKETILKELERVKWFLWHGNAFRADETLTDLMFEVDGAINEDRELRRPAHSVLKKLARGLEEFGTYIDNNVSGIGVGNAYQRDSWNRRSTNSLPSGSSRNSKCGGHRAGLIFYCRFESRR